MCGVCFADQLHGLTRVHTPLTESGFHCAHCSGHRLELHDGDLILRHLSQAGGIAHEVERVKSTTRLFTPEAPLLEELEHTLLFFFGRQITFPIGVLLFPIAALPMLAPRRGTPRPGLAVLRQDRFIVWWTAKSMLERHATLDRIQFHVDLVVRVGTAQRTDDVVDPRAVCTFTPSRSVDHIVQRHLPSGNLTGDQQVVIDALSDLVIVGEADAHAGAAAESFAIALTQFVTSPEAN